MKPREWIAIGISITALALSATSTYFATIVQREKLEGIILQSLTLNFGEKQFTPHGPISLLFANRGNMPLAIIGGELLFGQVVKDDGHIDCAFSQEVKEDRALRLKAFVIKPGEIVIKEITFDEQPFGLKDLKFDEYYYVHACARIEAVTTNGRTEALEPVGWWAYRTDGTYGMARGANEYPTGSFERWPFSIVDRQGSIFFPLQ
jgi:hypothetical protein